MPEVPGMSSKLATDGRPLWRLWLADTSVWSRLESLAPFVCNKIQCEYVTHCTIYLLTNHLMVIQYMALVVGNAVLTPLLPLLITQYHPNKLQ